MHNFAHIRVIHSLHLICLSLTILFCSVASSQEPRLVKDINTLDSSYIASIRCTPVNAFGKAYFCGYPGALWASDGSADGTQLLRSEEYGETIPVSPSKFEHVVVGDNFYFKAVSWLWVVNRDEPYVARLVLDSNGERIHDAEYLTNAGGELRFFARNSPHEGGLRVLWKASSMSLATRVWQVTPGSIEDVAAANGDLYFINDGVLGNSNGYHLWKSDGTDSGTTLVKTISGYKFTHTVDINLTNVGDTIYFSMQKGYDRLDLWKSDGTSSGTVLVKESVADIYFADIGEFTAVNDLLYFYTEVDFSDAVLWKSDGTAAGTQQVKRFDNGYPSSFTKYNNQLAFFHRGDLWISDGSESVTVKLLSNLDINHKLVTYDGFLYFSANDQSGTGRELWKSDGTQAGTSLVKDIAWKAQSSSPHHLTAIDAGVLFEATKNERLADKEIWISDGTQSGTKLVKDWVQPTSSARPSLLTQVGNDVYFIVNRTKVDSDTAANQKWQIWKSDGSDQGTQLAADIVPKKTFKRERFGGEYGELVEFDGQLYFTGNDGSGWKLWKTDGTPTGTYKFAQLFPDGINGKLKKLTVLNNQLLFFRGEGDYTSLWGLSAGESTAVLIQTDFVNPHSVIASLDKLFFVNNLNELWSSNGQANGTFLITQYIRPGFSTFIHSIDPFTTQRLTFMVSYSEENKQNQGERGVALWVSDGNAIGTYEIINFPGRLNSLIKYFGKQIYQDSLIIADPYTDGAMWVTDGTITGTQLLTNNSIGTITKFNGTVYFQNFTQQQLWKTDGTVIGTTPASNEVIDDFVNNITRPSIIEMGGRLYLTLGRGLSRFNESDSSIEVVAPIRVILSAKELHLDSTPSDNVFLARPFISTFTQFWATDGSSVGTKAVSDFSDLDHYEIFERILVNNTLFLSMVAGSQGIELWAIDVGSQGSGILGDQIWLDTNENGVRDDTEIGLGGVQIDLEDCDDHVLDTLFSDDRGRFKFENLVPGQYQLRFIRPDGYSFSPKAAGSDYKRDSNANPQTGLDACRTLVDKQKRLALDAGLFPSGVNDTGQIGDRVWLDINADGVQDQSESGFENVTVQLEDCNNTILEVAVTDNQGEFLFDQLSPADYRLRFLLPTGYRFSPRVAAGNFQIDSNPNPNTGLDACRPLAPGQRRTALDAGMYQ